MKLEEILPAFKSGKRIRRTEWKKNWYSQVVSAEVDSGVSTRICLFLDDILAEDWEEVVEDTKGGEE